MKNYKTLEDIQTDLLNGLLIYYGSKDNILHLIKGGTWLPRYSYTDGKIIEIRNKDSESRYFLDRSHIKACYTLGEINQPTKRK